MNGFLFPKDNVKVLREIIRQLVSKGKLSLLAHDVASQAKDTARNFLVSEAVEGYAQLLETVLRLPSEVANPKSVGDVSPEFRKEWKWKLFETSAGPMYQNRTSRSFNFLDKFEKAWNQTRESSGMTSGEELFLYSIWEEHKSTELAAARKKREDEEVSDLTMDAHRCQFWC